MQLFWWHSRPCPGPFLSHPILPSCLPSCLPSACLPAHTHAPLRTLLRTLARSSYCAHTLARSLGLTGPSCSRSIARGAEITPALDTLAAGPVMAGHPAPPHLPE